MCMSIEYNLYFVYFFYYVNDYNLFIIFVFLFMGGSMSAVMLLLFYLLMTMIIIILPVVLYSMCIVQSHNCISNIFVVIYFSYESCVSINFFLLLANVKVHIKMSINIIINELFKLHNVVSQYIIMEC